MCSAVIYNSSNVQIKDSQGNPYNLIYKNGSCTCPDGSTLSKNAKGNSTCICDNNGEFVGKIAPYGYIKDPKNKHKFLVDKKI